jgi:mono/diheme cytochrome c family protein
MAQSGVVMKSLSFVFVCSVLAGGCNYQESKPAPAGAIKVQTLLSFADLQSNIFQPKCVQCHSSAKASGGVDLSSYVSIMGKFDLISPQNPEHSLVYTEVASGDMPDGGPPLSTNEVKAISDWILAGAPNGDFQSPQKDATPSPDAPLPKTTPTTDVLYSAVQSQVFNQYCVRCHSGTAPEGRVDLSSFEALTRNRKKNLVVPGAASSSVVYTEVARGKMPPKGASVASEDLALLREWINQGAHSN